MVWLEDAVVADSDRLDAIVATACDILDSDLSCLLAKLLPLSAAAGSGSAVAAAVAAETSPSFPARFEREALDLLIQPRAEGDEACSSASIFANRCAMSASVVND